jgi:hypothetical protein
MIFRTPRRAQTAMWRASKEISKRWFMGMKIYASPTTQLAIKKKRVEPFASHISETSGRGGLKGGAVRVRDILQLNLFTVATTTITKNLTLVPKPKHLWVLAEERDGLRLLRRGGLGDDPATKLAARAIENADASPSASMMRPSNTCGWRILSLSLRSLSLSLPR